MLMCEYCQSELKSRGEKIFVRDMVYTFEESLDNNIPCECCDEYDNLWEV